MRRAARPHPHHGQVLDPAAIPIAAGRAGCCAGTTDDVGHAAHCGALVLYAGRWRDPHRRHLWRVFLCAPHRELLADDRGGPVTDVRELLDRDRGALQLRRDREADALAGDGWTPPRPLPE